MTIKTKKIQKNKKVDIELKLKNFGPISSGTFKLKPLTLFLGANNSGKSYATMLIHSIFEALHPSQAPKDWPFYMKWQIDRYPNISRFLNESTQPEKIYQELKKNGETRVNKKFLEEISRRILQEIFEKRLEAQITSDFGCKLRELIRFKKRSFDIVLSRGGNPLEIHFTRTNRFQIKQFPKLGFDMEISAREETQFIEMSSSKDKVEVEFGQLLNDKEQNLHLIKSTLVDICSFMVLKNLAHSSKYLPAERAGILQVHKALLSGMVKQSGLFGIKKVESPWLSGEIADFLTSVTSINSQKGPLYKLAREMEKDLLRGEIVITSSGHDIYPEIKYKLEDSEVPLHRFSSTVSELAPLILFLKYNIEPGNVLIVKEPETHLHPESQVKLTRYLAKIMKTGVYLILSTHSPYILKTLNKYLKRETGKDKANEASIKIKEHEVGVFQFKFDGRSKAFRIKQLKINKDRGISYKLI
ncbi:MAG: AAA family ATPase [Vulcanimicrobiota bacterium]